MCKEILAAPDSIHMRHLETLNTLNFTRSMINSNTVFLFLWVHYQMYNSSLKNLRFLKISMVNLQDSPDSIPNVKDYPHSLRT